MRLNVLTAVTRPENLSAISASLEAAKDLAPNVQVSWRLLADPSRQNIGGQAIKNQLIDEVPQDEWFWILDDDTLVHEDVLFTVWALLAPFEFEGVRMPAPDAIVVSQLRSDGRVLGASPVNMVVGACDIGQAFLRKRLVGDRRIPIDYNGDGMFLGEVLADASVAWLPQPLSLHNAISGVEVGV